MAADRPGKPAHFWVACYGERSGTSSVAMRGYGSWTLGMQLRFTNVFGYPAALDRYSTGVQVVQVPTAAVYKYGWEYIRDGRPAKESVGEVEAGIQKYWDEMDAGEDDDTNSVTDSSPAPKPSSSNGTHRLS